MTNIDPRTVEGFGKEWRAFDQSSLPREELDKIFNDYFRIFPWESLSSSSVGVDIGCGSGRWADFVAPKVQTLHCVDASSEALEVARKNLHGYANCTFHLASVDSLPFQEGSMDFGYALGVLHHVPDTQAALKSCVEILKPGAPFLLYLYYAFDNRSLLYKWLWLVSDVIRRGISRLPWILKRPLTSVIAAVVYWPAARTSSVLERLGLDVEKVPLSFYRHLSFYTMRNDALDRFGTPLEKRFTAVEIRDLMSAAGLERTVISDTPPYWCALGYRAD